MSTAEPTKMQKAMAQQNALNARLRKCRVLIVEDSAEARGMMRGFMRDLGVEKIDLATSGQEAIDYLQNYAFDIVLCDYNLGKGKDGQQVLEEARFSKYLSYRSVFIMVTAETTVEMVMGALEYQPDNYLSKPFTKNELQRRLERAVATKLEYKAIEQAFAAEQYEKTITLCQEKIAAEPGGANRAWRLMGESLLGLSRFEESAQLYRKVLAARELTWAKIGLGRSLFQLKQLPEAAQIFTDLVKEQPNVTESYDWLAKIQAAMGEQRVAQDTLEAACLRSPKAVLRQLELGRVAMVNRSYLVAEKAFRKAIMLSADSCYHTPDSYLSYVRALLVKLDGTATKLTRETFKEAQLFLARLRKEFPDDQKVEFRASLLEGLVCFRHQNFAEANRLIGLSQRMMENFDFPQRVPLADEYVGTLSLVDCFDEAEAFVHELQKHSDLPALANRLRQRIKDGHARAESEALNLEALSLYEHGKIMDAHVKFREAARASGASANLLLNAARVCLDLAERRDLNQTEWQTECKTYLDRLSQLDRCDHRFETFKALEERFAGL
ncbi:MAG: response regulator [Pseudomonadales bacterium]